MLLSVILCTHNPRAGYFFQTLEALRQQSLAPNEWELLIIDNASRPALSLEFPLPGRGRIVREKRLGLSHARATGIRHAQGELLVFCDDDNLFREDYLATARRLFALHPHLGAAGGVSQGRFEISPPFWLSSFADLLALRNLGLKAQLASWPLGSPRNYPPCAPIGAGMIVRRKFARHYLDHFKRRSAEIDRRGTALGGAGDCELVLVTLQHGGAIGYFPELLLTHLIPAERLRVIYLARLHFAMMRSWLRLLYRHDLSSWPRIPAWTVPFRQIKAFFVYRPWRGAKAFIRWTGVCGHLVGQADSFCAGLFPVEPSWLSLKKLESKR